MPKKSKKSSALGKSSGGGDEHGRNDLDRIGLFSEMGYISVGEKYSNKSNVGLIDTRGKGKQLLTNPAKRGHDHPSAYLEKEYGRAFTGEAYTDYVALRRRERLAKKAANIVPLPFKPSSSPQKPSGSGSIYGTIEHAWPLYSREEQEATSSANRGPLFSESEEHESLKNFITKPGKKGSGYGYPNVTIGDMPKYLSDPYDAAHQLDMQEREMHRKKMVNEKAFISCGAHIDYFDRNVFKGDTTGRAAKAAAAAEATAAATAAANAKLPNLGPFRPPGPAKSGLAGTINKYPSHEPDPPLSKAQLTKEAEGAKQKELWSKLPTFRPVGTSKTYPVRSVVVENVDKAMPPKYVKDVLVNARRKEMGVAAEVWAAEAQRRRCNNVLNAVY